MTTVYAHRSTAGRPLRLRSTTARLVALFLVAAGLILFSPAQPASASCSHAHEYRDNGYGSVTTDSVRVRQGPHLSCGVNTYTSPNDVLLYECWVLGDGVFGTYTWTYVHKADNWNAAGWVSDYYLNDGGALAACP